MQQKPRPDRASPNLVNLDAFILSDATIGVGAFAVNSKLKTKIKPVYSCKDCGCGLNRKMKRCKPCQYDYHAESLRRH